VIFLAYLATELPFARAPASPGSELDTADDPEVDR
jgi:hypothetical protein